MEVKQITVTVTCRTPDCENNGQPVTLDVPEGAMIVCGPCGEIFAPEDVEA